MFRDDVRKRVLQDVEMSNAEKYTPHYCVEDYQQWKGEWELWHGCPVSMSPSPFGHHSKLVVNVCSALKTAIEANECDATTLVELDWIVSSDTVVRPDVTVVCGDAPDGHLETRPEIVVEVLSESTRERDLTFKRRMYAEQSVPYYLILDPDQNHLTALQLSSGQYSPIEIEETLTLTICTSCNLQISANSLFS